MKDFYIKYKSYQMNFYIIKKISNFMKIERFYIENFKKRIKVLENFVRKLNIKLKMIKKYLQLKTV